MPNTPAAVGRGMTVLCANKNADNKLRDLCGELLATVGETAWVEDEGLIDAVTAVSGGGPAYVFLLIERSEEHTSELQSLMRSSYAVFCLKKKTNTQPTPPEHQEDSKYRLDHN